MSRERSRPPVRSDDRSRPRDEVMKTSINTGQPPHAPGTPVRRDDEPELALPHERDQGLNATSARPDARIEQARRDLAAGQVDTDLRATAGLDAERRARLLRGKP